MGINDRGRDIQILPCPKEVTAKEITALLHRAHARNMAQGLHFAAATQTEETTASVMKDAKTFVALVDGGLAGVVVAKRHVSDSTDAPGAYTSIHMLAVDPKYSGGGARNGLGRKLLDRAQSAFADSEALELDTASTAHSLVRYYEKIGFVRTGSIQWPNTNYLSVVLRRTNARKEEFERMKPVAFYIANLPQYLSCRAFIRALSQADIPCELIVPTNGRFEPAGDGLNELLFSLYLSLKRKGYTVRTKDEALNERYQVLCAPYYDEVVERGEYKIRYRYSVVTKPAWSYAAKNVLPFDCVLCYGQRDEAVFKAYTNTCIVGEPRILDMGAKRTIDDARKTILYAPTYESGLDFARISDGLKQLGKKYRIQIKLHPGTDYLKEEDQIKRMLSSCCDEMYDGDEDLMRLLQEADLLLSDYSGSIFNAMAVGVPVAVLRVGEKSSYLATIKGSELEEMVEEGTIPCIGDIADLPRQLDAVFDDDYLAKQKAASAELFSCEPKKGIERFCELVRTALDGGQTEENASAAGKWVRTGAVSKLDDLSAECARYREEVSAVRQQLAGKNDELAAYVHLYDTKIDGYEQELAQKREEIEACKTAHEEECEACKTAHEEECEACKTAYEKELTQKQGEIEACRNAYEAALAQKNNEANQMNAQITLLSDHIVDMQKAISYRCAAPIRAAGRAVRFMKRKVARAFDLMHKMVLFYQQYGFKATVCRIRDRKKLKAEWAAQQQEVEQVLRNESAWDELERWIDSTPHDFIDIFGVPMGWNTPLFQRFQHISLQVGKIGGISFYGAHPQVDKDVKTYKFVTPTLCIVNLLDESIAAQFWTILDRKSGLKYIRVQSIDLATTVEKVKAYQEKGYQIVYEYIDELTPQITGNIPKFVFERHKYLLENEDIVAIATSDKLFEQMRPFRKENMLMLNNGVDYDHWHLDRSRVQCPEDIKAIVDQHKVIIGYHGALAQWIDYDLLKRIADDKRFILLLIGHEHDGNLKKSGLLARDNVYYIGAKSYQELSRYAIFYDIAILPFVVNNITLSVSPVKIFEYMAAEKPVVSYALPECKKYKSCLCAETADEFMEQIENALRLRNDPDYLKQLRTDAMENTWASITEKMVEYVKRVDWEKRDRLAEANVLNTKLGTDYKDVVLEQILNKPTHVDQAYWPLSHDAYQRQDGDCKIIAYYLTQFHPDAHNEKWWGKGVTEWNNVCRAVPQYVGHYQPRMPGELGYYDLRIPDNMKRQIELAKMYGVYGFSFYYYWFDGERLLEKPLEMFLERKDMDFPFCICWANENWTRRFDGTNQDILIEQPKSVASYQKVIEDIIRFLRDPRYIQVDGKKVLIIYRPSLMPSHKSVLRHWREYCRKHDAGELYVIAVKENDVNVNWLDEGFDAVSEFHPGTLYTQCENITDRLSFLRKDFAGEVFSYEDIVSKQKYFNYDYPKLYRAVMPMWDNTARRNQRGMIFDGSTPALYKKWLKDVITAGQKRTDLEDNLIFVNAWNEWGEGTYLEPDKQYGYAYLQATREAVEECRDPENT